MREISKKDVGQKLVGLLEEKDPIDEDIGIVDDSGAVVGAVITKNAYDFFLRKVEEEEDRLDAETAEKFKASGEKDSE